MTVRHDDGQTERLNMWSELRHYENTNNDDAMTASTGRTTAASSVVDTEAAELQKMLKYFAKKPFLRHQAQGFHEFKLVKLTMLNKRLL